MNLDTKVVVGADKKKPIKYTYKFCIKHIFGSVYLKKGKYDNDQIMQSNF